MEREGEFLTSPNEGHFFHTECSAGFLILPLSWLVVGTSHSCASQQMCLEGCQVHGVWTHRHVEASHSSAKECSGTFFHSVVPTETLFTVKVYKGEHIIAMM